MKARIHRGADEIGGSCVELEADGQRLLLDLGLPLDSGPGQPATLPPVVGLQTGSSSLCGVVISHGHRDHWGLLGRAGDVPVYMGRATASVLREAAFFGAGDFDVQPAGFLADRTPVDIGPFRVTPFLVDHSAFDAYSLLVEAGGARLFYTGDFRGHGRKAGLFEKLLCRPPRGVDVLLMEGTHVGPDASEDRPAGPTEADVEEAMVATFRAAPRAVLVAMSAQNIDRVVTVYRAALRSGRSLVVDLYTATVAQATGHASIPQPGFDRYRVWVPQRQRVRVKRAGAFERVEAVRSSRVFPERLREFADEAVFLYRDSLADELEAAGVLQDAALVWSLWSGYLRPPHGERTRRTFARLGLKPVFHHASGHASIADLRRLATALSPRRLVPIHTFGGDRYETLFDNVDRQPDGAWWDIR